MEISKDDMNRVCKYFYPRDFNGDFRCHEDYCWNCKGDKDLSCYLCKEGTSCLVCRCPKCILFRGSFDIIDDAEEGFYDWILHQRKRKANGLPFTHSDTSLSIIKKLNRLTDKQVVDWSYYTICPKSRLGLNRLDDMKKFVKEFFDEKFQLYFEELYYVVESGKHEDNPNLHIHFVGKFLKDGSHNFRSRLIKKWNSIFEADYDISYKILKKPEGKGKSNKKRKEYNEGIKLIKVRTQTILNDKIKYLQNDHKGSHENFIDLGIAKHLILEIPT